MNALRDRVAESQDFRSDGGSALLPKGRIEMLLARTVFVCCNPTINSNSLRYNDP